MASSRSRSRRAASSASPETPEEQAAADAGETPDSTASAPEEHPSTAELDAAATPPQEPAAAEATSASSEEPPAEPGPASADAEGAQEEPAEYSTSSSPDGAPMEPSSRKLPETDPAPPDPAAAAPPPDPAGPEVNGQLPPWVMTEAQREKMRAREAELGPEKTEDLENATAAWSDDVSAFIGSGMSMDEPEAAGLVRRAVELVKQMTGGDLELMRVFVARFNQRFPDAAAMGEQLAKLVEDTALPSNGSAAPATPPSGGDHDYFLVLEDKVWWHGGHSAQARKGDRVCRVTHNVDEMAKQGVKMEPCDPPNALSYEERGIMPPPYVQPARPQLPSEPQRDGDTALLRKGVTGEQSGS